MLDFKERFYKDIFTLFSGTSSSQIITILFIPILARLYSVEDFGLLALFIAITSTLGVISNGRYDMAIYLPKTENEAEEISKTGLTINFIFSFLTFIVLFIFFEDIKLYFDIEQIEFFLIMIPLSAFFIGYSNVYNAFAIRLKSFKDVAKSHVIRSFSCSAIQAVMGYYFLGPLGLILGSVISNLISSLFLIFVTRKNLDYKPSLTFNLSVLKRYKDFPKFSVPSIFANKLSINLVNGAIPLIYSLGTLGIYSMTQRFLSMPMTIIGSSIGQVLTESAAREVNENGTAQKTFNKSIFILSLIGIAIFFPLYFLSPFIFVILLGEKWALSGTYGQILVPLFFFNFLGSALSPLMNILERQKLALSWQVATFLYNALILIYSYIVGLDFTSYLKISTFVMSFHYIVLCFIIYLVSYRKI